MILLILLVLIGCLLLQSGPLLKSDPPGTKGVTFAFWGCAKYVQFVACELRRRPQRVEKLLRALSSASEPGAENDVFTVFWPCFGPFLIADRADNDFFNTLWNSRKFAQKALKNSPFEGYAQTQRAIPYSRKH